MRFIYFIILLSCVSCGDSDFKKVEQLDEFRVLAIEANNPEVAPGGTADLRLFVSDASSETGRVVAGDVVSCIDPGISMGAEVSCDHDPNRVESTYTIDTTAPDFSNNVFTGFGPTHTVTVPATIFVGRSSIEESNGVGYIVIFSFEVDDKIITTFKRIMATQRSELNMNPSGTALLLNGTAFTGTPKKGDTLNLTTSAPEDYSYTNVDGVIESRTEDLKVAWYIVGSELDYPKADVGEEIEITESLSAESYVIVAIVRDDRGGIEVSRVTIP